MTKTKTYSARKKLYIPPKIEIIFKNEKSVSAFKKK